MSKDVLWNLIQRRVFVVAFLNMAVIISINAQDKYDPEMIVFNGVKEIEAYIFEEEGRADSFLITKEYFNKKGRRTKIAVYDSVGIRSEYIYKYKDDTLRTERITKIDGEFLNRTEIHYDKKNREVKAIDYDINDRKTGTYSKTKYNDRKSTKETKIYFSNRLSIHSREKYDEDHKVIEYSIKKNGKWVQQLDKEGKNPNCKITEAEDYQNSGLKLIKEELYVEKSKIILGLKGKIKLSPKDVLTTEKYLNENGLIVYERQFLNGEFIALKKYRYFQ